MPFEKTDEQMRGLSLGCDIPVTDVSVRPNRARSRRKGLNYSGNRFSYD